MQQQSSKSPLPKIVGALAGLALFCVSTYLAVDAAGGTKVEPDYSNTPNAVTPGAPAFK